MHSATIVPPVKNDTITVPSKEFYMNGSITNHPAKLEGEKVILVAVWCKS